MRKKMLSALLLAAATLLPAAVPFYVAGPRNSINLAGEWQAATADTLSLKKIPSNLNWKTTTVPTGERGILPQSVNSWGYPPEHAVEAYLEKDKKTFKIKKDLSAWYRKTVDIPADALKNHTVHLVIGAVAFRSAFLVNGQLAGESIQATLPRDVNITKYLRPGKNEIVIAFTGREGLVDVKNDTYIAPSAGIGSGIHNTIRLDFRPLVAVDDVFVKTKVKKPQIDFELTLVNRSGKDALVTPQIVIRSQQDPNIVHTTLTGTAVKVPAGKEQKTTVRSNWKAPVLWDLHTPVLYDAEIRLLDGKELADSTKQSFGYREFEIRGRDFYLNGNRVVLLRGSSLAGINSPDFVPMWDGYGKLNSNRLHLGFCNPNFIRLGDHMGYLVVPEAAWWHVNQYPHEKAHAWLPGTLEYYKGWIKHLRNHPSIVIWSLANETYWNRTGKEEMAIAKKLIETVRSMDDTRPLQGDAEITWNNQLDIVNIHYPEWSAGEINTTYPNAGVNMPNDTWYLRKGKGIKSWRAEFDWDRPLVIGEYFCNSDAQVEEYSSFMGDTVFDGEKWTKQRLTGLGAENTEDFMKNLFTETLKKYTTEYRAIGVAGMNIWTGEKDRFMPQQVVRPYDFHPNADSGKVFRRKIVALNDGRIPLKLVRATLTLNGTIVWQKEYQFHINSGSKKEITLEIPMPQVLKPASAELLVALFTQNNPAYAPTEVSRYQEEVYIVPEINLAGLKGKIAAPGKTPALEKALALYGLKGVSGRITPQTKLVVIASGAFQKEMADELGKFVENGGTVLILPQEAWQPFRLELPERDKEHAATQAWMRTPSHPAVKEMKEGQFSFWRPNNIVTVGTFKKPFDGAFELPLDCGGRFGMRWTPLLDIPVGKGTFLLTTFDLEKASLADPGAKQLLANLIEYGSTRAPKTGTPLNLLAGTNTALMEALELAGIAVSEGVGSAGPVLADASAEFTAQVLSELKEALKQGRTVWLHNFDPSTISKAAALLPFKPVLAKKPAGVEGAVVRSDDPLMDGLANFDFFWYRGTTGNHGRVTGKVVAKTGDWILETPWGGDAEKLIAPAFLTKIKSGKGTVLFDTLRWENATSSETDKALRIASLLAHNLGAAFKPKTTPHYKRFFIDLSKFANMGYYDRVENDGKGGWTDQGKNDMRFFLINHTGKINGADDGMDVPVPDFPTKVDFQRVVYQLIDPKANDGKAVISLGSEKFGKKLPRQAGPFAVGQKAEILWFLHSSGWTGPTGSAIAEYTVKYDDGTSVRIPIRMGMEVGDWHDPKAFGAATVAWTGANLFTSRVGVWTYPWKNPHPEKTIRSITLKGGLSQAQYVLLAITGGVVSDEAEEPIAEWDFVNKKYSVKLWNPKTAPERVKDGFRFRAGRNFAAPLKKTDVPAAMKMPYSVFADFTPEAGPDGYMSGIVQMCDYMKSGFRIVLHKDLRINVEIFPGDGKKACYLRAKTPLELNRRATCELKFDGKKALLLINGKLDSLIDCPFPKEFNGDIMFGNASGSQYHFNGRIHSVAVNPLNP